MPKPPLLRRYHPQTTDRRRSGKKPPRWRRPTDSASVPSRSESHLDPRHHQLGRAWRNVMERRSLGNTGLQVSALGFGAGPIGDAALSEDEAARLLHGVLDAGINLIDTAPSYGL